MKLNIEVCLDSFMGGWGDLDEMIQTHINEEVLKVVKKSPEYKEVVKAKTERALQAAVEAL